MIRTRTAMLVSTVLLIASGGIVAGGAVAGGSTVLIATKKLIIKDYEGKPLLVKFISKDPVIDPAFLDVLGNGAVLRFADTDAGSEASSVMPAGGWSQKGTKPKFVFKGTDVEGETVKAKLSPGKLKIIAKGDPGFHLVDPNGVETARVIVTNNTGESYCAATPGMDGTNKKDDPEKGIYVAVNAEAPALCPSVID